MGVDVQGLLITQPNELEIKNALQEIFHKQISNLRFHDTTIDNYYVLLFDFNDEKRMLNIHFDIQCDYEELHKEKTLISLGLWGSSQEIIKKLVEYFGGYYIPSDSGYDMDDSESHIFLGDKNKLNILTKQEIELFALLKDFKERSGIVEYLIQNQREIVNILKEI